VLSRAGFGNATARAAAPFGWVAAAAFAFEYYGVYGDYGTLAGPTAASIRVELNRARLQSRISIACACAPSCVRACVRAGGRAAMTAWPWSAGGSGFVAEFGPDGVEAAAQLGSLQALGWLDSQTIALIVDVPL
jgi:hypothetical protein